MTTANPTDAGMPGDVGLPSEERGLLDQRINRQRLRIAELERKDADWKRHCDALQAKLAQAVQDEREQAITAYASHIDVALREYSDNLSYGDDALGPGSFIERGMEAAASAIRARSASRVET